MRAQSLSFVSLSFGVWCSCFNHIDTFANAAKDTYVVFRYSIRVENQCATDADDGCLCVGCIQRVGEDVNEWEGGIWVQPFVCRVGLRSLGPMSRKIQNPNQTKSRTFRPYRRTSKTTTSGDNTTGISECLWSLSIKKNGTYYLF